MQNPAAETRSNLEILSLPSRSELDDLNTGPEFEELLVLRKRHDSAASEFSFVTEDNLSRSSLQN